MSASASKSPKSAELVASGTDVPFVEDDAAQTVLPYDTGGVPFYIAFVWVAFIITYIVVVSVLVVPDLRAWFGW
jgi:hypothetical protein